MNVKTKRNTFNEVNEKIKNDMADISDKIMETVKLEIQTEVKDAIIKDIKDEIIHDIANGIDKIKADVVGNLESHVVQITRTIKNELYDNICAQIKLTTNELKIDTKRDIECVMNELIDNMKKNFENTKSILESDVNKLNIKLRKDVTNDVKTAVREDITSIIESSNVSFELNETPRIAIKTAMVLGVIIKDDRHKLVALLGNANDPFSDYSGMYNKDIKMDYIAEVATTKCNTIIGAINSPCDGINIFELDTIVYCIFDSTLFGKFICQSNKFPCYAQIQIESMVVDSTLGKIFAVHNAFKYIDIENNTYTELEYINQQKKNINTRGNNSGLRRCVSTSAQYNRTHLTKTQPIACVPTPNSNRMQSAVQQINRTPRLGITSGSPRNIVPRRVPSNTSRRSPSNTSRITRPRTGDLQSRRQDRNKPLPESPKLHTLENIEEIPTIYKFVLVKYR